MRAAARVQAIVPDAVVVGGAAAALHAQHRFSYDDDHVLVDLRDRYDEILERLEAVAGWRTARIQRPVQILGSLDGIETGIRQLRRSQPLATELYETPSGPVRLPTLEEMLRVKAWLVVTRNATRDYVDVAALAARIRELEGANAPVEALLALDALYPQESGESAARQLARQLAEPRPYDFDAGGYGELRGLQEPWQRWPAVERALMRLGAELEIARASS